ncbi:MAG: hypothetical protein ACOYM9_19740 [Bradymonadia bacterium]|jgi:hypothetical protein
MRLRDVSELVREPLENDPEALLGPDSGHPLVQDVQSVQTLYRAVAPSARRDAPAAWLAFSFAPYRGLIDPFNIYPGRFWGLVHMHKQPSGLPELAVHIARDQPGASQAIAPDLLVSFSNSQRVETDIVKEGREPATLKFFHKGGLPDGQGGLLPGEFCLPGFAEGLPPGDAAEGIPGMVEVGGATRVFLGDLVFYNQFRTVDRAKLRTFVLNCVAAGVVARYVREIVKKSMG